MNEYALLIDGEFKEIRLYGEKPVDIPHKKVTWYPVVRETGKTEFTGLKSGKWVIRILSEPPTQTNGYVTTVRRVRLHLLSNNLLDTVEEAIKTYPKQIQVDWEYEVYLRKGDPLVDAITKILAFSETEADEFFGASAREYN